MWKILNNFWEILKTCYIISHSIFIRTNLFHLIPKFTLITFSIKNLFYFHFSLFLILIGGSSSLTSFINEFIEALQTWLGWKILCIFINYNSCNSTEIVLFLIILKDLSILWSSFLNNQLMVIFLINNQTLLSITYNISF